MAEKYYFKTNKSAFMCKETCKVKQDAHIGGGLCATNNKKYICTHFLAGGIDEDGKMWIWCSCIESATGKTEQELIKQGKLIIE